MNVLLSSLIKRRWPERAGLLIGLYITALSAGAIVGSLVSVPLWQGSGGSVALTLGWLAAPAALGGTAVAAAARSASRPTAPNGRRLTRSARPPRHPPAWRCTGTRSPGTSRSSWACSRCCTTPRCPGCRRCCATGGECRRRGGRPARPDGRRQPGGLAGHPGASRSGCASQLVLVVPTVAAIAGGLAGLLYAPLGGAVGVGADPRRGPERRARARDLLHRGPRAGRGHGGVAVGVRAGGRGTCSPARARSRSGCCTRRPGAGPRRSRCCSRSPPCCWSAACWPPGRECCAGAGSGTCSAGRTARDARPRSGSTST